MEIVGGCTRFSGRTLEWSICVEHVVDVFEVDVEIYEGPQRFIMAWRCQDNRGHSAIQW